MVAEINAQTSEASAELGLQVQSFIDQFEQLNHRAGCDDCEDQVREQIAQLSTLHSKVNEWGRDYLSCYGSADGLSATFDLTAAIEAAIDERYDIMIG